jgi:hypothetical protein
MNSKVYVDPILWSEIMYMVHQSKVEISFMCDVTTVNDMPYVFRWYLPEQKNSGSSTEMCPKSLGSIPIPEHGYTNVWIHSHVQMGVFWSSTDMDTIKQLGKNGYVISIVVNQKDEYKCSYYQAGDGFYPPVFQDDIPIVFGSPLDEERKKYLDDLMEKNCKSLLPTARTVNYLGNYNLLDSIEDFRPLSKKEMRQIRLHIDYQVSNNDLQEAWEDYYYLVKTDGTGNEREEQLDSFMHFIMLENDAFDDHGIQ